MRPVKRIELVVEAVEKQHVIELLKSIHMDSFTFYPHVGGYGKRGIREHDVFGDKFENMTFVIACEATELDAVITVLRPILKHYGGMCLISDAQWVVH